MTTTTSTASTASNILSTLGAGSGMDIQALAQNLVDAEQKPKVDAVNAKIAQCESRISGYGALKSLLSDLKTAFQTIDDASDFASLNVSNPQSSAFSVSTGANAAAASFDLSVTQVAKPTRYVLDFDKRTQSLNSNGSFTLTVKTGAGASSGATTGLTSKNITVSNPTPAGIVSAINGANAGISAQLIDTGIANAAGDGTLVKVVITGTDGAANDFTLTPSTTDVSVPAASQSAGDAAFTLNGVNLTRSSNTVSDVLTGVTLKLNTATAGTARVDLTRQTADIVAKMKGLVTAYNTFRDSSGVLGDRASKVETYGAALAGDSLLTTVQNVVRRLVTNDSTTPGTDIAAPRDVGLSIDRYGKMTLDEARLTSALQSNFDQVVNMFTAGKDAKSDYGTTAAGSAGEAVRTISKMLRVGGLIDQQSQSTTNQVTAYQTKLTAIQDRMQQLLQQYLKQFTAMDNIVGESKDTRSSLTSSFKAMTSSNN